MLLHGSRRHRQCSINFIFVSGLHRKGVWQHRLAHRHWIIDLCILRVCCERLLHCSLLHSRHKKSAYSSLANRVRSMFKLIIVCSDHEITSTTITSTGVLPVIASVRSIWAHRAV